MGNSNTDFTAPDYSNYDPDNPKVFIFDEELGIMIEDWIPSTNDKVKLRTMEAGELYSYMPDYFIVDIVDYVKGKMMVWLVGFKNPVPVNRLVRID